ncbi:hypothetical protein [Dongia sp.]|uniref:hypothetical protein n=1 Tax=Dongia sp. TaxID=1977262 RepID=UPI0035AFB4B4
MKFYLETVDGLLKFDRNDPSIGPIFYRGKVVLQLISPSMTRKVDGRVGLLRFTVGDCICSPSSDAIEASLEHHSTSTDQFDDGDRSGGLISGCPRQSAFNISTAMDRCFGVLCAG